MATLIIKQFISYDQTTIISFLWLQTLVIIDNLQPSHSLVSRFLPPAFEVRREYTYMNAELGKCIRTSTENRIFHKEKRERAW